MRFNSRFLQPRRLAAIAMSIGIGGVASLALVTDASAHDMTVSGTASCSQGTYTVDWTVTYNVSYAPFVDEQVLLDSDSGGGAITGFPSTLAQNTSADFTESGISQTLAGQNVSVYVEGKYEDATGEFFSIYANNDVTLPANCQSTSPTGTPTSPTTPTAPTVPSTPGQVATAAPTLTQGVCTGGTPTAAFVTIPGITGVTYLNGATTLAAGNVTVPAGTTYVVTAAAQGGFTLIPGSVTSWSFTAGATPTCTPAVSPSVLGVTFVAPTVKSTAAALPFNGMPLLPTSLVGIGFVLAGALLVGSARRHTKSINGGMHRA
jgi:hypothetical protein